MIFCGGELLKKLSPTPLFKTFFTIYFGIPAVYAGYFSPFS